MLKMICLAAVFGTMAGSAAAATELEFDGRHARAEPAGDGGYRLHASGQQVEIAAQPMRSDTGSVLFDALFALAQQELDANRVDAIRDPAFDDGQPVPCECFQTGARWPYVWTRDMSFASDLALARVDPVRTRQSLRFKLSAARDGRTPGLFVAQDTGSGGSWPISSDRVVWFLGARGLLDDPAFADEAYHALQGTLAQDRQYVFDAGVGLYRGETSFLDWREQTYPGWTAEDVRFIGESYALSTNVLHYQALRLAQSMAQQRSDAAAARYQQWADALRTQIDRRFWREDAGLYMSYLGPAGRRDKDGASDLLPVAKYDLLGLSLGVLADVFPPERARRAMANYPATAAGSPVVWPQQADQPIYHNRAIWPFVSAYSLRAARRLDDAPRIAMEIESILRGAALAGSNMENYEMLSQAIHVEDGKLSGPVVNSQRQLWSVAGYLAMVREGVFGIEADGTVAPKLPVALVPMLFGQRDRITLKEDGKRYVLVRPVRVEGELLVAGKVSASAKVTTVQLVPSQGPASRPPSRPAERFAPPTPAAPEATRHGDVWRVSVPDGHVLWRDGVAQPAGTAQLSLAPDAATCLRLTRRDGALESLPSAETCLGANTQLVGANDWRWTPPHAGFFRARLRYENPHGPINTGVTAAVKQLRIRCEGQADQLLPVTMPHSVGAQDSTGAEFVAGSAPCHFTLEEGFNMSALAHFAHYTGGQGGREGVVNDARVLGLQLMPLPAGAAP
ncbi:MAG TPA: Six-hairpin glycosidase-like protein [Stenotrophomonas sp.]